MNRPGTIRFVVLTGAVFGGWPLLAGDNNQPPTADPFVGATRNGGTVVTTGQTVKPAGDTIAFGGRPGDLALSPDSSLVYLENIDGLVNPHAKTLKVRAGVAPQN